MTHNMFLLQHNCAINAASKRKVPKQPGSFNCTLINAFSIASMNDVLSVIFVAGFLTISSKG